MIPKHFGRLLEEGIASGHLRNDLDVQLLVRMLVAVVQNVVRPELMAEMQLMPGAILEKNPEPLLPRNPFRPGAAHDRRRFQAMSKARPILIVLVILVVGGLVYFLRKPAPKQPEGYPGYGEGELVYVSSSIGGQLKQLNVSRGDQAALNQDLFILDREEEQAMRSQAEENLRESNARLEKAKLDFERAKNLSEKKVIAPQDYDSAEQEYLSAQHNVAALQQALQQNDWKLRQKAQAAPAQGLVYDTYYRPGEWVPGRHSGALDSPRPST